MIKIDIKLNKTIIKKMTYSGEKSICEITKDINAIENSIVTYKLNNQFIHGKTIIDTDAVLEAIQLNNSQGIRIYQDFIIFLMNLAVYNLFKDRVNIMIEHSIADGVYCEFIGDSNIISEKNLEQIHNEMISLIEQRIPIEKITVPIDKAYSIFEKQKRYDLIRNLNFWNKRTIEIYKVTLDNKSNTNNHNHKTTYYDYYPRPLAPHTGCLKLFDFISLKPGFVLRFPTVQKIELNSVFELPKMLFLQHQEHDKWLKILDVQTVGDLNKLISLNKITQFILTEEALHEKKLANLADSIFLNKNAKFVLIAGPSSSGKTTFAKRLSVQLKVNGLNPYVIGLDDYFLPRSQTPRLENGEFDFESINSLDIELINNDLNKLLNKEEVTLPRYNFITGERESSAHKLKLRENDILIIEGIHGLNDYLTESIPQENKIKIYISALNQLNLDYHNRIPTTECRKIRRIARDAQYRGYSAEETLTRWISVRDGEDKNIFPFQENADFMFNSSLTYELAVLRKHVMPLLRSINYISPVYNEAQDLIALFEHFLDIKDELVPNNSLLREFTSNSIFSY
ncbi:MAG: nucleoside kinase [Candidatus Cloacimonetes bacterium]|jgi:uridine kinase|nr:nucleoside kinase [Candidatus Cloacimonadota bacterium]MDD4155683.1 nucleoside kinase [Candidatus Cloacimonadota bacterium]